jgi:hypothetical protein
MSRDQRQKNQAAREVAEATTFTLGARTFERCMCKSRSGCLDSWPGRCMDCKKAIEPAPPKPREDF